MTLNRRHFLQAAGAGAITASLPRWVWANPSANRRPNILLMLADDLGYNDLGCYGGPEARTPHLDQLATEGVRFTDFYAAAPICSPSRAGLMTGRFPTRTGVYTWLPEGDASPMHLQSSELTLPELLKAGGYDTCHLGKWHLSKLNFDRMRAGTESDQPQPKDFGFDHSFGTHNNALPSHADPRNFIRNGTALGPQEGYACQLVVDEAIEWLNNRGETDNPFFMYMAFHEPHERVAAPPEMVTHYDHVTLDGVNSDDERKRQQSLQFQTTLRTYYACIENMDDAIGRMLTHLDNAGLADNTLILFYSDNGSRKTMSLAGNTNAPLRSYKSSVYDGGIRVPALMRWPGEIEAGVVQEQPVGGVDLLPTLCGISGVALPHGHTIDGIDILPAAKGKPIQRDRPLYWFQFESSPAVAIRDGDWTLIGYLEKPAERLPKGMSEQAMAYLKSAKLERFELYNIRQDPSQNNDLSTSEPDRCKQMTRSMVLLHQEVVDNAPRWQFEDE